MNLPLALFSLLLVFYLIFLAGIFIGLKKIKHRVSGMNDNSFTLGNYRYKLSVIIPFRNESENILNSLNCIERQDYPKELFEVIYVNDSSTDDSFEKLINAGKSFNVKVISAYGAGSERAFKKIALKKGIELSGGEIIISTDADTVFGNKWLSSLAEKFDEDTDLVAGPVNLFAEGGLFKKFQALEFSGLVLAGAGLVGINRPVICNGANLAYRRRAYEEAGGFERQLHLSSGEDELLMQSISKNSAFKIKFSWDKNSLVSTAPASEPAEFLRQRKRWASKTLFYPDPLLRFKLLLIFLFYLGIPVQLLLGIFLSAIFFLSFFISMSGKCISEYFIIKTGEEFLYPKKILKHFLAAEMLQTFYIIISAVSGLRGRFEWKGRRLKR